MDLGQSVGRPLVGNKPNTNHIIFSQEVASLADGESITSDWIDFARFGKQQQTVDGSVAGLTYTQELRTEVGGNIDTVSVPLSLASNTFTTVIRKRYQRITITNNTGSTVTGVTLTIKAFPEIGDGISVVPLSSPLVAQTQAALTKTVITGQPVGSDDASAVFKNVAVNQAGGLLTGDFGTEVARGLIDNYDINKKFGRNSDIDTGSAPEDVWNGGGLYTGFNATSAETLEFFSSDANDVGALVSSGTATGGDDTTLIDSAATFISDGVAVGDAVLNDTQVLFGIITSVDSETQVTVFRMEDGEDQTNPNAVGDAYRIATASSTGAAVMKVFPLDGNFARITQFIILNGTTAVDLVGTAKRQDTAFIVLAGSSGTNEGQITGRQKTTTANVTMVMPAEGGRTAICCATVPSGELWIIKSIEAQMARANGSAGSADVRFQTRKFGSAWNTRRFPTITDALEYKMSDIGGIIVQEGTDIRWNIQSVSDNNTIVSGEFEYFILT